MILTYDGVKLEDMPKEEVIKVAEGLFKECRQFHIWNEYALNKRLRNIGTNN